MSFLTKEQIMEMGFGSVGRNVLLSDKASFYNCANIYIDDDVRIDDFCILSAGIGGIYIGSYVHIAAFCGLFGIAKINLGDFCGLSSRVTIYSSTDDYTGRSLTNPLVSEMYKRMITAPVVLDKHVIVGAGSVIMPGVVLGTGVAIGALSFVNRSCDSFSIYVGTPIRKLGERERGLLDQEKLFLSSVSSKI